jgi:hypothetical protein
VYDDKIASECVQTCAYAKASEGWRSGQAARLIALLPQPAVRLGMEENKPLSWPARGVNTSMLKSSLREGSDGYFRQTTESENLAAP